MPRPLALLLALLLVPLLAGCGDPPAPPPTPEPTATPAFASDEEALAAAVEAYTAYLTVSDAIAADGGVNPERINPYVADAYRTMSIEGFSRYSERGLHTGGASSFDRVSLTRCDNLSISIYLCLDVSKVRIMAADGSDVTPADRLERLPLEVEFEKSDSKWLLSRSDIWTGYNFC